MFSFKSHASEPQRRGRRVGAGGRGRPAASAAVRFASRVRGGVTLTEVLGAILIAGIGMISLMTLFPIAILRSIRATQLTNGTVLRFNAESTIDVLPDLVHDPDGDGDSNEHFNSPYIVDPLGWSLLAEEDFNNGTNYRFTFGNQGADPGGQPAPPMPATVGLSRFSGNDRVFDAKTVASLPPPPPPPPDPTPDDFANAIVRAQRLAMLPDSWLHIVDAPPVAGSVQPLQVTLDMEGGIDGITVGGRNPPTRAVLIADRGRVSQVRILNANPTLDGSGRPVFTWDDALPIDEKNGVSFADRVEQVVVETQARRYSWLLTVRKSASGKATIEIVIFFNRTVDHDDEFAYVAPGGGRLFDRNPPGSDPDRRRKVKISLDAADYGGAAPPKPLLKKGSYVLDATNGRWYLIQDVLNESSTGAVIVLDRNVISNGTQAVFLPGIIDVYPIKGRSP